MASGFWGGMVEGFSGRREQTYQENQQKELQNRQLADRVFSHLLSSRDPEMQALALSGLMQPLGGRKKGATGFMGGVESSADPGMAAIVARMNEMVPDDATPAPRPSAGPGSAAMSTNQMTRPGSAPPQMPGSPLGVEPPPPPQVTDTSSGVSAAMPPDLQGIEGPPPLPSMHPVQPQASKWKKRGTGVPTAEEIAEASAAAQMRGRITAATGALGDLGASPEQQRRAAMGIAGAPDPANDFVQGTMGVKGIDGKIHPVSFNRATGKYQYADGTPVPATAEVVPLRSGASPSLTSKIPDTDEGRAYLLEQGVPPAEIANGSPTGYWKVVDRGGVLSVQPDMYTPPPALTGTFQTLDDQNNAVIRGVTRGGSAGPVLGAAVNPQGSTEQAAAQALLQDVEAAVASAEFSRNPAMKKPKLTPQQTDQLVRERAVAAGLPYQTFFELQQATKIPTARQQTPRANAPKGSAPQAPPMSIADRVRERALKNRNQPPGAPPAP